HLHEARVWHDQRDELLRVMAELAIVTETVGKLARDVSLLSQAEVGEMLESPPTKGVGGSSAMPHKRNPVACLQALTAALRAPGLLATLLSSPLGEHDAPLRASRRPGSSPPSSTKRWPDSWPTAEAGTLPRSALRILRTPRAPRPVQSGRGRFGLLAKRLLAPPETPRQPGCPRCTWKGCSL